MKTITCDNLYAILPSENNIIVLDIRDQTEYLKGHILNSINYPFHSLLSKNKLSLKTEYTYYVICDLGVSSPMAVNHLLRLGYKAINVSGGLKRWTHETYK